MADDDLPLRPPDDLKPVTKASPAPAWVALGAAWVGLLCLLSAVVLPFLPGSHDPRAELEQARPYALADRFIPIPLYGSALALFLGIIVLWQMRHERRPLPDALVVQRVQAWVGIGLALIAAAIVYAWVAVRGPG